MTSVRPASATLPFSSQERFSDASFTSGPSAGLLYLVISGLLWGTGGLTGSLLGRVAGLSAIAVAACRLTAGGVLIVCYLTGTRRPGRPAGRPGPGSP